MTIQTIERIPLPDRDTFYREYIYKRKPVVITDLFKGSAIRQVDTLRKATEMFGGAQLVVRNEYISARSHAGGSGTTVMSFADYWARIESDPTSTLLCTEYDIPAPIMRNFKLPDICLARDLDRPEMLGFPRRYGDHDLYSNLFIANRGNKAHIHYDGDHRQVLLYQVFGRKEVVLLPPAAGAPFKPLDQYNLDLFLDRMTLEQRLDIVDKGNGYYTVIEPGEAIYMPMLIWHYLGYVDDGMSFNVRFGRNRAGRFLCIDNFHRDYYLQNFASQLADPELCDTTYADSLAAISELYQKQAIDLPTKIREMRVLFRECCREFCPDARIDAIDPESEAGHLREILRDVGSRMPYLSPMAVRQMRPEGPIAAAQKAVIQEKSADCGYTPQILRHILFNRTGKEELGSLTKAEAVQMLAYLASPGARC